MTEIKKITNIAHIPDVIKAFQEFLPRPVSPTAIVRIEYHVGIDDYSAQLIDVDAQQRLIYHHDGQVEIVTWERAATESDT